MKNLKTKKYFWSKIIFILIFVFSSSLAPLHTADAWLSIPAALIGTATNWLMRAIEGMVTSMIKKAGAMAINKMMSNLVGGGSSGKTMFITDWQDYLRTQPAQKTQSYMNDYLTQMTQGRGSVSSYAPAPPFEGVGNGAFNTGISAYGNYSSRLKTMGEQQLASGTSAAPAPSVTYSGNPGNMFDQFNFKQLDVYRSGVNNPWAFGAAVESKQMASLEDERDIAMAKSIANAGFEGTEVNGKTIAPGSLVKEKMAGVEDIGNKILASESNMAGVIGAVITQLVTKSIEQGIGNVQAKIQKEVVSVENRAQQQMNSAINQQGPKAIYRPGF
jgi:hypothetical protein